MSPRFASCIAITVVANLVVACDRAAPLALEIVANPDADPFLGADAATVAALIVEDDATPEQDPPVSAMGEFMANIQPANPSEISRLRIEARRGGVVLGSGATPPTPWAGLAGQHVRLFLQPSDSLQPAPGPLGAFAHGRVDLQLVTSDPTKLYAVHVAPDAGDQVPEAYNLLSNLVERSLPQIVPSWCDGNCSVVPVRAGWLLLRGKTGVDCTHPPDPNPMNYPAQPPFIAYYNGASAEMLPNTSIVAPTERCDVLHSTVMRDPAGDGGWLLGGHSNGGAPVVRVDHAFSNVAFWQMGIDTPNSFETRPPQLQVPRDAPDVIELRPAASALAAQWLIAGGQTAGRPFFETYSPGAPAANVVLASALDARTGAATACVAHDANGCSAIMVVGGRDGTSGSASIDDVLIDGACARALGVNNCPLIKMRGSWITHRRWNARLGVTDGGIVVVAGGHDLSGAVLDVETIDASGATASPPAIIAGRTVGTIPCADPAVTSISTGSVMIAGGSHPNDRAPCTDIWFYRR